MRYFYLNIFLIAILLLVFSWTDYSNIFSTVKQFPTAIPTTTPTPTQAPPVRLIVPKLAINTEIEPVSVEENNVVEAPDGWDKAGWYSKEIKPGEMGTAVMVGHYDDQFGAPALFYDLNQLEMGDMIKILSEDGGSLNFVVREKTTFPYWSSIDDLVIDNKNRSLILITCSGWWNQALQSYSERLIIRSVLVDQ